MQSWRSSVLTHLMRETIGCNHKVLQSEGQSQVQPDGRSEVQSDGNQKGNQRGNQRCNQERNQRGRTEGASTGANTHHPPVPLTGHPHDIPHTELEAGRRSRMPNLTLRAVLLAPGRPVADAAPVSMEGGRSLGRSSRRSSGKSSGKSSWKLSRRSSKRLPGTGHQGGQKGGQGCHQGGHQWHSEVISGVQSDAISVQVLKALD